jgi:biotin carboxyl carrier protein
MKMENELRASRDGQIKDVHVSEGDLVEAGRLLTVIE